jgi:hypothetical protein
MPDFLVSSGNSSHSGLPDLVLTSRILDLVPDWKSNLRVDWTGVLYSSTEPFSSMSEITEFFLLVNLACAAAVLKF